jgi:hypothetical protein
MKIASIILASVMTVTLLQSCGGNNYGTNKSESSTERNAADKWYCGCEGIDKNYGESNVANAALRLLRNSVGSRSSYRFFTNGPVEKRNNCQFIVPVQSQADIGEPFENLRVRIGWDGKEFYLQ